MVKNTRTKERSCKGKIAHETWEAAYQHINRLVAAGAYRPLWAAYKCKKCGKKHVGHRAHARKLKQW